MNVELMAAKYAAGQSLSAIARRHRTNVGTVWRLLREVGVTIRPRGCPGTGPARHFDRDEALALYRAGWTTPQIAEKLGTTDRAIQQYTRGIKTRVLCRVCRKPIPGASKHAKGKLTCERCGG